MAVRPAIAIVVAVAVAAAVIGFVVYLEYFVPQTVGSKNWAGYADAHSVGSASGTIAIPPSSEWHGNGTAALWVGMGGSSFNGGSQWPFWQAGVEVTCTAAACTAELFDEGGTAGPPSNGVCPVAWTQDVGVAPGDSVAVYVSGGTTGAVAILTVDDNGINTTYHPAPWATLAGVTAFPSAEWIFESPQESGSTLTMPTLTPPGAVFSSMSDSTNLSSVEQIQMQDNPNGQSVGLSSFSDGSFSAYSQG